MVFDNWETPQELVTRLEIEFGKFDLDPCATKENTKAKNFFTKEQDGLKQKWFGKVFVNPPYSRGNLGKWTFKAQQEINYNPKVELIIMLLPVRTSTNWFHKNVLPFAELRFIKRRIKFLRKSLINGKSIISDNVDFYGSMFAIYKNTRR